MNYSIYHSPTEIIESTKSEENLKLYKDSSEMCDYETAQYYIETTENGNERFLGKTDTVIGEFYSPHSYESNETYKIIGDISGIESKKFAMKYCNRQTSGIGVNVGSYLSGSQKCWYTVKKQRTPTRMARVFAPMGGIADITDEEMRVCGCVSCIVTEYIESMGINTELWASCVCNEVISRYNSVYLDNQDNCLCTLIKIKDSEQYCDYGMINYITGNHHFYRNIIFRDRVFAACRKYQEDKSFGYGGMGSSFNMTDNMIPFEQSEEFGFHIVIPRIYSKEAAKEYLENTFMNKVKELEENYVQ